MCYRLSHHASAPSSAIHCGTGGCGGASTLHWEGVMITPIIHRGLTREDLARLVAEIGRVDQAEARAAEESLQAGEVDAVLDSPAALEAVHGRGGAPAAVPLTLLWYVPVRAALRAPSRRNRRARRRSRRDGARGLRNLARRARRG